MTQAKAWMELDSATAVADAICSLYADRGHAMYDEAVSQSTHGVQAALQGGREGAPPALRLAGLLHDIGHLLEREPDDVEYPDRDLKHEEIAARFLSNWFGPEVTEPIRHHVSAKRYLVSVEPAYEGSLSLASVHSLALQGGPMSPNEAEQFISLPGAADAVVLRRWDDLAKDPNAPTPAFDDFRDLIAAHCSVRRRAGSEAAVD